jgi:hypothetical protein
MSTEITPHTETTNHNKDIVALAEHGLRDRQLPAPVDLLALNGLAQAQSFEDSDIQDQTA